MEKLCLGKIDFEKYLVCPKCNLLIDNPYEISCCGELYCYSCVEFADGIKDLCQKCNKMSEYRQNSFIKRIINQMDLKCSFDCGKKFNINEIKNHMISCELRQYVCYICIENNLKNTFKINNTFKCGKTEMLEHLSEQHDSDLLEYMNHYQNFKNYLADKNKKSLNIKQTAVSYIDEDEKEIEERIHPRYLPRLRQYNHYINMPRGITSRSRSFDDITYSDN